VDESLALKQSAGPAPMDQRHIILPASHSNQMFDGAVHAITAASKRATEHGVTLVVYAPVAVVAPEITTRVTLVDQ